MNHIGSSSYEGPYISHYGIRGQKWGQRRYQNDDGSYTAIGRQRHAEAASGGSSGSIRGKKSFDKKKALKVAAGVAVGAAAVGAGVYLAKHKGALAKGRAAVGSKAKGVAGSASASVKGKARSAGEKVKNVYGNVKVKAGGAKQSAKNKLTGLKQKASSKRINSTAKAKGLSKNSAAVKRQSELMKNSQSSMESQLRAQAKKANGPYYEREMSKAASNVKRNDAWDHYMQRTYNEQRRKKASIGGRAMKLSHSALRRKGMIYYVGNVECGDYLAHHGIKGQKWGVRRFQNIDGSYTSEGRRRYGIGEARSGGKKSFDKKKALKVAAGVAAGAAAVGAGVYLARHPGAIKAGRAAIGNAARKVRNAAGGARARYVKSTARYARPYGKQPARIGSKTPLLTENKAKTAALKRQAELARGSRSSMESELRRQANRSNWSKAMRGMNTAANRSSYASEMARRTTTLAPYRTTTLAPYNTNTALARTTKTPLSRKQKAALVGLGVAGAAAVGGTTAAVVRSKKKKKARK